MEAGKGGNFFSWLEKEVVEDANALRVEELSKLRLGFLEEASNYIENDTKYQLPGLDASVLDSTLTVPSTAASNPWVDEFVRMLVLCIRDLASSSPNVLEKGVRTGEVIEFALRLIAVTTRFGNVTDGIESLWELVSDSCLERARTVKLGVRVLQTLRCIFRPKRHPNSYFVFEGKPLYPRVMRALRKDGYAWSAWIRIEENREGKYNILSFIDKSGSGVQFFIINNVLQARTLLQGAITSSSFRFTFKKGLWYSIVISHHSSSNAVKIFVNGEIADTVKLPYPSLANGMVQYTVGGFHGCMSAFHLLDQTVSVSKVRHLFYAGPDFFPDTHRLKDGPVAMLPQIPCIHGLQKRGVAISRRAPSRVLVRYVFGLSPKLFNKTNTRYVPIAWESLGHYGQDLCFAPGSGSVKIFRSPSPHENLLKVGGLYLILQTTSPGGIMAKVSNDKKKSSRGPTSEDISTSAMIGEVLSLIADLISHDPSLQLQFFTMGCQPIRTALLNYFHPTMAIATGVMSLIVATDMYDKTPGKVHLTEAVGCLIDVSYWATPYVNPEALVRLLRLFESLVERYPKPFANSLGPLRVIDWLRSVAPSAFGVTDRFLGFKSMDSNTKKRGISGSNREAKHSRSATFTTNAMPTKRTIKSLSPDQKREIAGMKSILNVVYCMLVAKQALVTRQNKIRQQAGAHRQSRKKPDNRDDKIMDMAIESILETLEAVRASGKFPAASKSVRGVTIRNLTRCLVRIASINRKKVFKCLESRVVNSIPNIRSDGTQKSTAFARLGFGIGFGFFGDGGGTDLDDLNGEEEAMYEGGGCILMMELLKSKDHDTRLEAMRLLLFWTVRKHGKSIIPPDTKEGDVEYPVSRIKDAEPLEVVGMASIVYRNLKKHGTKALKKGMREMLMALSVGRSSVTDTGTMVEVNDSTRLLSPAMLDVILALGAQASESEQERVLLDVYTCLRSHSSCLSRFVSERFWQNAIMPYLHQDRHPALFALHIAHHSLRHCLTTYKNGWVAAAEMRWCIEQWQAFDGFPNPGGKPEEVPMSPTSRGWGLIVWQHVLHGTLSPLLPVSGPYKGTLSVSAGKDINLLKENLVPTMHMLEEALFDLPKARFEIGSLPPLPDEGPIALTLAITSPPQIKQPGSLMSGAEGLRKLPRRRSSMELNTDPADARKKLLLSLLVGVMEHFPLPSRRQDVLRVLLRFLRYVLPKFNGIAPHVLGYMRQLFKLRLVKRSATNIRTLVLALCLVRDASLAVDEEIKSFPSPKPDSSRLEEEETKKSTRHINLDDMQRCLVELFMLWRGSIIACFPKVQVVVDSLEAEKKEKETRGESSSSLGILATEEALAIIDFIRNSPEYGSYMKLCADHEAWFERVMGERRNKEAKMLNVLLSDHYAMFEGKHDVFSENSENKSQLPTLPVSQPTPTTDQPQPTGAAESKDGKDNLKEIKENEEELPNVEESYYDRVIESLDEHKQAWVSTSEIFRKLAHIRRKRHSRSTLSKPSPPGEIPGGDGQSIGEFEFNGEIPSLVPLQTFRSQFDIKSARRARRIRRRRRLEVGEELGASIEKAKEKLEGRSEGPDASETGQNDAKAQAMSEVWWLCPAEDSVRSRNLFSTRITRDAKLLAILAASGAVNAKKKSPVSTGKDGLAVMNFSTAGVARDKKDKAEGSAGTDEKDDKLADTGPQPPKGLDTDMDMDDDGELEAGMEEGEDQKGLTNQAEDDKQQDSLYGKVLMQRDCILISALAKVMGVMIITSSHVAFHAKRVYEDCAMGIERVSVTFATLLALDEGAGLEGSNNKNGPETQGEACRLQLIVSCSKIRQVMPRLFLLQDTALEVFFKNHTSCFINFPFNAKDRNDIYGMLTRLLKLPHELSASRRLIHSGIVSQWQRKEMSNFQYLMHINTLAGRSYNDVSQYPVFPWVLQDYTSKSIDLTDSKFYRDLTKPMGMINPSRCEIFEERYENPLPDVPPFHYGSHYSSPAVVNYFLVRVEPYSTLARTQQGGRFDLADRLFDSVERAWNLSYSQSSDVKELIPEFFSNPAFLRNVNGLDLGTKQNGKPVGDVELPPWSKGKPEEFIRIHREALESEYVSANLHLWIDLIFGHRQQGKGAEEAKNLFYYLTYPGQVDLSVIDDQKVLEATLAQISSFGQTPRQLWTSPHPPQANKLMPSKLCLPIELPPLYEGISFCNVGGEAQIGGIAVDPKGKVMIMTTDLVARVLDISTMLQALTEVAIQLSGDVKLAGMLACATVGPTAHLLDLPKSSLRYNKGSVKRASVLTRKSRTSSKGSVFSEKSGIKTPFSVGSIFGSKRSKKGEEEEGELIPFKGPFKLDCPEWLIETISPPLSLPKPTPGGSRSRPRTESNRTAVPTLQEEESELEETPESKLQSNTENPGIIRETENSQLKTPSPENLGPVGHVSRSQRPNKPHKREARRLIALSSNARFAFIGGYEDKCFRCYMCDGKVRPLMLSQVSYHRAKVTSLRLAPSQAALVTGDETGQVCLWNTAVKSHQWRRSPISLEPIANFRVHDGRVIDCALHLKAGVCISVGLCHALGPSTNCVAVYSTYLNRCVRLLFPPKGYTALRSDMIAGRRGPVYFIVYVEPIEKEDARKAEEEGMLVLYSATGDLIAKRSMGGVVTAMETTPQGAYIACGMQSGELVFVRSSDLSVVQALNPDHQTFEPTYDTQTSNLSSPRNKMGGLSNSPTRTPRGPSIAPPPIPRPFSATLGPTDGNSANPSATTQMTKSDNLIVMSDVPSNAATGISNPIISATESKQGDLEEEPRPQESGALSPTSFIRESRESLFNDSHGALGAVTSLSFVDNEQFVIASYSGGLIRLLLLPQSELLPGFDFFASAAQQIKPALGECIREGRNRKVSVPIEPDSNPDQGPVKTQPGRLKTPTPKAGIRSSISGMVRGFGSLFSRKKQ